MKLKEAIKIAIMRSEPVGLDDEELYQELLKMARTGLLKIWKNLEERAEEKRQAESGISLRNQKEND